MDHLSDAYRKGHLQDVHIETFLAAFGVVKQGTKVNAFLSKPETPSLDREFDFYWAELSEDALNLRLYLTEEIRRTYLDTAFRVQMHYLNRDHLQQRHFELKTLTEELGEGTPAWGAMYLALRVFESVLVHIAYHHRPTRRMVESRFKDDHDGKRRVQYCNTAREQARASILRWQAAVGLYTPPAPPTPETLAQVIPFRRRT
ncbi:MAG: hypothetical protein U0487_01350 [Patescibacteria group bacterium]